MKKKTWFLLDNAAKIFPCISSKKRPNMFSVSAVLVEDVNKEILQETITTVLQRFPSYNVKLKRGIFWYYLEENNAPYCVEEESPHLFDYDWLKRKNGYLFNLTYFKNKITLTIFHSLTDGTGAMEFLKTIVYQYLKLTGKKVETEGLILVPEAPSVNAEGSDNYNKYYDSKKSNPPKEAKAYHIEGTTFEDGGIGTIIGTTQVDKLKELAKNYDVTLTTYLCALFTYSLYQEYYTPEKPIKKPVKLFVPVNMRKIFKDETMRNFAGFIRLETYLKPNLSFDDLVLDYKKQMEQKVTKEYLCNANNANVKMERNWFMRITPLFIKNIAMKIGFAILGSNIQTVSISNLGVIKIPKSMEQYIENIHFDLGANHKITKNFGICSYKNKINLSFCRSIIETGLEQKFFKFLADQGLNIEINSNYWEM